jgi:AAA15 family ATPase/GTPase
MQKIDSIEIKNFKSIRHQKIEGCKRINVFIGYPNVGKSNILEALSLLTFIREKRRPTGLKGLVRLEKLSQLFNYNNIQEPAVVAFNKDYSLLVNYEDENFLVLSMNKENEKKSWDFPFLNLTVGIESLNTGKKNEIDDFSERFPDLKKLGVKPYKYSESKIFSETFSALELKIPFGRNLFELIVNNSKVQKEFSELLKPYNLNLVIDVSTNDVKISPKIKNGIIQTIPISLMADTLVRLVFFKTAILTNKDSILLFEEPEAHMFPPYVKKLTSDIIFDENNNQYFIATHSPYVLNEFIEEMQKDLAIYLVDYDKGETVIKRLTDDQVSEIAQYGIDLFFNLETYLDKYGQPHSA